MGPSFQFRCFWNHCWIGMVFPAYWTSVLLNWNCNQCSVIVKLGIILVHLNFTVVYTQRQPGNVKNVTCGKALSLCQPARVYDGNIVYYYKSPWCLVGLKTGQARGWSAMPMTWCPAKTLEAEAHMSFSGWQSVSRAVLHPQSSKVWAGSDPKASFLRTGSHRTRQY